MREEQEQGRFEELIKARMDNYEVDAPANMWANIEAGLATEAATKVFSLPRWAKYVAAAAVVVGAIATFSLLHTPPMPIAPLSPIAVNHVEPSPLTTNSPIAVVDDGDEEQVTPSIKQKVESTTLLVAAVSATPEVTIAEATVEERVASYERKSEIKKETVDDYAQQLAAFEQAGREATAPVQHESIRTKNNNNKLFTLSLLAANGMANSNSQRQEALLRNSANYQLASTKTEVEDVTYKHAIPLSFGVKVAKQLSPLWSLESGLVYSILASDMAANHQKGEQMLHYLGIPVHAIWQIATVNKFQFYLTTGAQVDFNVYGSQRFDSYVENVSEKFYTDTEIEKAPQWSLHTRGGASYQLFSKLALYMECGAAYYLNNNSSTVNVWKEQPLNFDLQLGLRTHF